LDTNKIAISMYRKHGFLVEGIQREAIFRNGVYVNYNMMSILRSEYGK
jgi:RimJ/RimL family protein N-acetyltransferase